jgi:signal peptidase II
MKTRRLIVWTVLVFALDQLTKYIVSQRIPLGHAIPIIPNFFDLVHVTNKGAAFGLFGNFPNPYRFIFITVVSLIAVALIIYYYWNLPETQRRMQIPLLLILGGAAGNIFDRIFRGAVIDFLSVHWYDRWVRWEFGDFYWHFKLEWPAFNVADMAISLSVIWLLIALARGSERLE